MASPFFGVPSNPPKTIPGMSPETASIIQSVMADRERTSLSLNGLHASNNVDLSSAPLGAYMAAAPEPTLRERAGNAVYDLATAFGIPSAAQQYRNVVTGAIDFVPGVGDIIGAQEVARDFNAGNYGSAAIGGLASAVGIIPGVGDLAAKGIRKGGNSLSDYLGLAGNRTEGELDTAGRKILQTPKSGSSGQIAASNGSDFTDDEIGYDLPPEPPTRATEQYGGIEPPVSANGVLRFDIDGNPLVAPPERIAGLSDLGVDRPISPSEVSGLAEDLTGQPIMRAPGSHPDLADPEAPAVGLTYFDRQTNIPQGILVHEGLNPLHSAIVDAHEVGHGVDLWAKKIPTDGIKDNLKTLYHQLAKGSKPTAGQEIHTPMSAGYPADQVDQEYMAEAIRAYFRTPNEIKANYPDVAKRIREYVNTDENLMRSIQFNSMLGAGVAGGAGLAVASGDNAEREREEY